MTMFEQARHCSFGLTKTFFMFHLFLCQNRRIWSQYEKINDYPVHLSTRLLVNLPTCQLAKICQPFSKDFNTMSVIFIHQPPTLPQKIDSREGLFWCKKGLACECSEMNIYLKRPPFAPHLGLFAAKCTAIWCKTQCNMPLNAVRFGAKCSAFWC